MTRADVLVVKADPATVRGLRRALRRRGLTLDAAGIARDADRRIAGRPTSGALLIELDLGAGVRAWDLARFLREANPELAVIDQGRDAVLVSRDAAGKANGTEVDEPISPDELADAIAKLCGLEHIVGWEQYAPPNHSRGHCLRMAEATYDLADCCDDPQLIGMYLDIAARWLALARELEREDRPPPGREG